MHRSGVAAAEAAAVPAANGAILIMSPPGGGYGDVTQDPREVMATVAPAATGCYAVVDAILLAHPRSPALSHEMLQVQT